MAFGCLRGFLSGGSGTAREGFLTSLGGGRPVRWPAPATGFFADGAKHKAGGMMGRGNEELVLVAGRGGRAPLKRKPVKRDWTKAKEANFIEQLAVTCNVTLAAKQAGVGNSTVYARRRKDAAFRGAWGEALAQAYARLEVETLERTLNGRMRTIVAKDGSETREMVYDERTALSLLRLHRDNAREPERLEAAEQAISPAEAGEVRAKLMAKLKRVRIQLIGKAAAESQGWDEIGKVEPLRLAKAEVASVETGDGGGEGE
jgi:hypothetical protein